MFKYSLKNCLIACSINALCLIINPQLTCSDLSDLPAPYNSLEAILPFDDHGWYANDQSIEQLFKNNKINTAIEIGSWLGSSTRHIASLLPINGILYAVDTWNGSDEHQPNNDMYHSAHKLPTLYQQFLSNIIHTNLVHKVCPVRMTSLEASSNLSALAQKIDFIYLDAAHDTESVFNDMEAWYPYVSGKKGILCGDDWDWESVRIAVRMFAQKHNVTICAHKAFWFIVEKGQFGEESFLNAPESIWSVI